MSGDLGAYADLAGETEDDDDGAAPAQAPAPGSGGYGAYDDLVTEQRDAAAPAPAPAPGMLERGRRALGALADPSQWTQAAVARDAARPAVLGGRGFDPGHGAGRGKINPPVVDPSAPAPKVAKPYASRMEALDDAVNLLEEGADKAQVFDGFRRLGITQQDIAARGQQRGSEYFRAQPGLAAQPPSDNAVSRSGVPAMRGTEPGMAEGAGNLVRRVKARGGQIVTGAMLNTGVFDADDAAPLIAQDERKIQAAMPGQRIQEGLQQIGQSKTFGDAAVALASNPAATFTLLAESVLLTAPALAATGARLPAAGLAAVMGGNSGAIEFGGAMADALADKGVDMVNAAEVTRALNDPATVEQIKANATKRGLAIGAIDALTAGLAGKFLQPALRQIQAGKLSGDAARRATVGAWAKELGMQVAGGAGGEAVGQALTGDFKPADILLEGLGEAATGPLEVRSNLAEARAADPARQMAAEIEASVARPLGLPYQAPQATAWDIARAKGFHVDPPLTTDKPGVSRSKTAEMFRDLGAKFGLSSKAIDATIKAADGRPLEDLGPFLRRAAAAFQARGMFGSEVDPDVLGVFDGPMEPPPEPVATAPAAAPAPKPSAQPPAPVPPETVEQSDRTEDPATVTGLAEDVAASVPQIQQGSLAKAATAALTSPVDIGAHQAATSPTNARAEPTQAQKEAGNYKVGRARVAGMDIRIENPQGSKRRGVAPDGTPWETEMQSHYGYFPGTEAADGDALDVFVKPGTPEDWKGPVFVVDQIDPKTGKLDEHKVVMGARDEAEASALYRSNYDANWQGEGAITRLPLAAFKAWAKSGRLKEPLGDLAPKQQEIARGNGTAPDGLPAGRSTRGSADAGTGVADSGSGAAQQPGVGGAARAPVAAVPDGAPVRNAGGGDGTALTSVLGKPIKAMPAWQLRQFSEMESARPEIRNAAQGELQRRETARQDRVAGMQTGQLLRLSKTTSAASEDMRRAAATEVKRRETDAMYRQRAGDRGAQEQAILDQARDEQATAAVASGRAADSGAPTAMQEAFERAGGSAAAPAKPRAARVQQANAQDSTTRRVGSFEVETRPDGTITVLGNSGAIKKALPGVRGISGTRGVTYGRTVSSQVIESLGEPTRQAQAAEAKAAEEDAAWQARDAQKQDEQDAIVIDAQAQQADEAAGLSRAAELEAPTAMAEAFSKAIKAREDAGDSAFSIAIDPPTQMPAISREELGGVVESLVSRWKALSVKQFVIAEHVDDFPSEVVRSAREKGLQLDQTEGVLHRSKVYLLRPNIRSQAQAEAVLFHEVLGHLGTYMLNGGKRDVDLLSKTWQELGGLPGVRKLTAKHDMGDGTSVWDRLQPYIRGSEALPDVQRQALIMDEMLAFLAQRNDTSALTRFKAYLSDLKASVVALAREWGLTRLADLVERSATEWDVLALLRDARSSIETGVTPAGQEIRFVRRTAQGGTVPAFSQRADEPVAVPDAIVVHPLSAATKHADYEAAKAGDLDAGIRLARDLVTPDLVAQVRAQASGPVIVQPVDAVEATGRNKIPRGGAEVLAAELGDGATAGQDIVQSTRAFRTAMDGLGRIFASPEFDGHVVPGAAYVLVDDTLTQGGTFASLASHIRQNGGRVAAVVALTGKGYSAKLTLDPTLLKQVRELYSEVEPAFRAATGRGFDSLTESEARYLARHKSPDAVRDRITAAGSEGRQRPGEADPGQGPVTDSPAFRRWFGDSKVVGVDGAPLVVFHGTSADISTFDAARGGTPGSWFTTDPQSAGAFGTTTMPVYLSIKKPGTMQDFASARREAGRKFDPSEQPREFNAAVLENLRSAGFDGIHADNFSGAGGKTVWMATGPEQIKSATGNRGTFDPEDPDIAFSVKAGFALPEFGRTGKVIEAIQNRYNRWKQAVDAVRQQGGTVTDANDFYQAEERYWGIVGAQLDDFKGEVQDFVKAVKKDGLELSDVALYAYAQHAPERNAQIAKINPKFEDGGSGMTNDQAQAILDDAAQSGLRPALEKHAATLRTWTAATRKALLDAGLISQAEFNQWTDAYKNYVPLRGYINDDGSRRGTGGGFDIRGKESIRAMGRKSLAGNIVEHILQDRARAHIRAGKNDVLRRFGQFVLDNPDPSLWEINAVERRRGIHRTPSGEEVVEHEAINKAPENTVALKDAGETIYITVKDQALLTQLKNLQDEASLPFVIGGLQWANRLLSRMYTSLNPVFTVLNGARDVTAGAINMVGVAGYSGAGKLLGNLPNAYREAFMAEVRGKPSKAYDEYRSTGGKTGFMDFKDIEGYAQELAQVAAESEKWRTAVATPGGWAKTKAVWRRSRGSVRRVLDAIESYNGAVENATRFAAFKAARESGKSVAQASSIAKNITVNFNRRGSMGPVLSAWFLFFNPAIQGSTRMVEAMRSKEVLATIGTGMAGVFGLALANAMVGGDDEGDGMAYWDKVPPEVKERNLVIMLPPGVDRGETVPGTEHGRYIKIPLPYGFNAFAAMATTSADMLRNTSDPVRGVSPGKGALRILKAFVGAWVPVSDVAPSFDNPKASAMIAVPDALDPVMEAVLNVNSFGGQLYPEGMGQDKLPDSEKVWGAQKGTWKHSVARWLNEKTGGSLYHEGAISVTPAAIENVARGYGGGVTTFLSSLADTLVTQGVNRDSFEWWRAPFVRQLYGEVDTQQAQALAYDRLSQIEQVAEPLKRAEKAGDERAAKAIRDAAGPLADLGKTAQTARQRLTKIRKEEIRVIEDDDMSSAAKNASLRGWERERRDVYDGVNRAVNQTLEADQAP